MLSGVLGVNRLTCLLHCAVQTVVGDGMSGSSDIMLAIWPASAAVKVVLLWRAACLALVTFHEVLEPCPLRCAGRIIVVGGMSGSRQRLNSVAAYDPREGLWQVGAEMSFCSTSPAPCLGFVTVSILRPGRKVQRCSVLCSCPAVLLASLLAEQVACGLHV